MACPKRQAIRRVFVLPFFPDRFQIAEQNGNKIALSGSRGMFDGAVVIFRRGDAFSKDEKRIWQGRFKLDGRKGYKTIRLKTRNHAVAKIES